MTGEKINFEQAKAENNDESRKNERSTIDFPYLPLDTAIEVANAVYNRSGYGSCEVDELAAELGQTVSGAFRQKTACAKTFGLVDKDGRSAFKLSDLGKRIIDPDENTSKEAKLEAFFEVPLYSSIFDQYKGQRLPPPKALEREMQTLGVSSKQTDKARQVFDRSAHHAGLHADGNDRLVRPRLENVLENKGEQDLSTKEEAAKDRIPPKENNFGEGGNLPPDIDPIIAGLIARLPQSGSVWPKDKRKLWLDILENSFDLVYEDEKDITFGFDQNKT